MQLNKNKKSFTKNTSLKVALAIVAFILIGVVGYAAFNYFQQKPSSTPSLSKPPTPQEIEAGNKSKQESIDRDTSTETPPPSNLTVVLNGPVQNESSIQIRAIVIDYVSDSGECTLTMSKAGRIVERTVNLQSLPSSTTCKGFDLATSDLDPGVWQIRIVVTSGDKKGEVLSSYEVK